MFGHQDDQPQQDTNATSDKPADQVVDAEDRASGLPASQPSMPDSGGLGSSSPPVPAPEPAIVAVAPPADDQSWQHPGTPLPPTENDKEPPKDVISPAGGFPKGPSFQPPSATAPLADMTPLDNNDDDTSTDELVGIKQKALSELSPLIDQLDQPPEEKFRTIMMMIQASDDQTMVKAAYAAAHSIDDEKARAQALLDIINEVNYFTHQPEA